MTRRCRNRVRSRGKLILNSYNRMVRYFAYIQPSLSWREWKWRQLSQREAQNLVAGGEAERIVRMVDGELQVVGYRALSPTSWERPSPATLTHSTMVAVGKNAQGCRLTSREKREVEKFKVWPLIGDTRAIAVRPRMSDAERRAAETLLSSGRLPVAA